MIILQNNSKYLLLNDKQNATRDTVQLVTEAVVEAEVFCKKDVLRNFAKFTGNTCGRASFLIKLQA